MSRKIVSSQSGVSPPQESIDMTTQVHPQPRQFQPYPGQTLGVVAFAMAFVAQPVALVMSIIALIISYRKHGKWNAFAIAGIITSVAMFALGWLVFLTIAYLVTNLPPTSFLPS